MTQRPDLLATDRVRPFGLGTENRFPLDLQPSRPAVWEAYEQSLTQRWDPEDPMFWNASEIESCDLEERRAAALVWSHRAWVEFTGIAESEALLVRICLERDMPVDTKYCLSLRAVEKARATDACHLFAAHCDSYRPDPGYEIASVLNADLVRRALHDSVDPDAFFVSHIYVQALIDARLWERSFEATHRSTTAGLLMEKILADKRRQLEWAWNHTVDRSHYFDAMAVADNVMGVLEREEFAGRRVAAFLPACAAREELVAAQNLAASAGLGAIPSIHEEAVLREGVAEAVARLRSVGVDLPNQSTTR
jgi:hypothetical protein